MHRYPENTTTTAAIAIAVLKEYQDVADDAAECSALWHALSTAADQAAKATDPDWPKVKALWLVADACSMMLRGDSLNEPFGALAVFEAKRSAMPEDYTLDDMALLSEVAASVTNRALRARLSDLAWLGARPRKIADAHRAIDAYMQVSPTEENHYTSLNEWRRAITLCLQLGKGARDRLEAMETRLMAIAEVAIPLEGTLGMAAARTLFDRRLGSEQGEKFPELLAARGEALIASGECFRVRAHLGLARDWYEKLGNAERAADMTLAMALSWETEADQRIQADTATGHLVAGSLFEDAIQTLRKIPNDQRPPRGVDAHLERLQRRLNESGQQGLKGLPTISSGSVDITEIAQLSEQAVSGKPLLEALLRLAYLHAGADVARLNESARQSMRTHSLSALFASSHYSADGRVIAKTPGGGLGDDPAKQEAQVFETVMRHYLLGVNFTCRAQILPAMAAIQREHTICTADLAQLMSQSPMVPPGRAEQFAKALWEGFEHDFATAIYLLAPQIEHLVRWHLKQAGAITSRVDGDGIENEIGLSSLIEDPEARKIFGENDAFELQALFCSAYGPNLRNQVAHGLLSDAECHTTTGVYAWWWTLRLTLRSFLQAVQQTAAPSTTPADDTLAQ